MVPLDSVSQVLRSPTVVALAKSAGGANSWALPKIDLTAGEATETLGELFSKITCPSGIARILRMPLATLN